MPHTCTRRWIVLLWLVCAGVSLGISGPAWSATDVSAKEVHQLIQSTPDLLVLDVRTPAEFAAGHLPGAVNVDMGQGDFEQRVRQLRAGHKGPWVVYCRTGRRSAIVIPVLESVGVKPLYHFNGGIVQWTYPQEK